MEVDKNSAFPILSNDEIAAKLKDIQKHYESSVPEMRNTILTGLRERADDLFMSLDIIRSENGMKSADHAKYAAAYTSLLNQVVPRAIESEVKLDYQVPTITIGVKPDKQNFEEVDIKENKIENKELKA
jgi:hypothetical protein